MRGCGDLSEALRKSKKVSISEMSTLDSQMYVMKRKYCGDCKFFNRMTKVCTKDRIIRICRKKFLKNKE